MNHADLFANLNKRYVNDQTQSSKNSLSNLDQQHLINASLHILFHLIHVQVRGLWTEAIAKLRSFLLVVLFYKVSSQGENSQIWPRHVSAGFCWQNLAAINKFGST